MAENPLFNIIGVLTKREPAAPAAAPAQAALTPAPPAIGVITAQQSAITFAGAPAAVTLVWKVLGSAIVSLKSQLLFPIGLSLVLGMLIYWQSAAFNTRKEKVLGFVFALINSFAIAAAALGIDAAVK